MFLYGTETLKLRHLALAYCSSENRSEAGSGFMNRLDVERMAHGKLFQRPSLRWDGRLVTQ